MALENNISAESPKTRDLEGEVSEAEKPLEASSLKEKAKEPSRAKISLSKDFQNIADSSGRILNQPAHIFSRYIPATLASIRGYYAGFNLATLIGAQAIPGGVIATSLALGYVGLNIGYVAGDLLYRAARNTIKGIFHPVNGLKALGRNIMHPAKSVEKMYHTAAKAFDEPSSIATGLAYNLVVSPVKTIYKSITNSFKLLWRTESYQPA